MLDNNYSTEPPVASAVALAAISEKISDIREEQKKLAEIPAMLIADELQEVMPEAVTGEKDAVDENGNPVYQQIDVTKTLIWLIGAFQEYVRTHP
ncbi:hypothetical protein [Alkanindiges illinoisensis]|uniref:Uncharacterized protein n=1 Tax=Alkanindiges illinoisensis TaxID=197183 RepID=A0A4Y7XCX6_9GAMM|nr:hypothetical protein [Alkanindiges illinoisensis]TEU26089.1 hypothetical protein E2B99_08685 [Alkanindiges illinoisensis]